MDGHLIGIHLLTCIKVLASFTLDLGSLKLNLLESFWSHRCSRLPSRGRGPLGRYYGMSRVPCHSRTEGKVRADYLGRIRPYQDVRVLPERPLSFLLLRM